VSCPSKTLVLLKSDKGPHLVAGMGLIQQDVTRERMGYEKKGAQPRSKCAPRSESKDGCGSANKPDHQLKVFYSHKETGKMAREPRINASGEKEKKLGYERPHLDGGRKRGKTYRGQWATVRQGCRN